MELGILIIDVHGIFMELSITVGEELGTTCLSSELCSQGWVEDKFGPLHKCMAKHNWD